MSGGFRGGGEAGGAPRNGRDAPEYVRHVPKFLQPFSHMMQSDSFKTEAEKAWQDFSVPDKAKAGFVQADEDEDNEWVETGDAAPLVVDDGTGAAELWKRQQHQARKEGWQQHQGRKEELRESKEEREASKAKEKGNAAHGRGKYDEAIQHFGRGIVLTPRNHVLYSNRSASYACKRQYKEALADAQKCISLAPDWSKGFARAAAASIGLKDFVEAAAMYDKALKLDPTNDQYDEGLKQAQALLVAADAADALAGRVRFKKRDRGRRGGGAEGGEEEGEREKGTKAPKREHQPKAGSAKLLSFAQDAEDPGG